MSELSIKPPPDSTYRARVKKLQARLFDRTDLGGSIPWKWCAFVAIVWLAFGAFNWLVLLDKTPIKDHQRLAFMYGPAMTFTDTHKHLVTAERWALLYFFIPLGLIAAPVYFILNNKKSEFAGEARAYSADQGRLAVSAAAQKTQTPRDRYPVCNTQRNGDRDSPGRGSRSCWGLLSVERGQGFAPYLHAPAVDRCSNCGRP